MIVVDTSVWIAAERGGDPAVIQDLRDLLSADAVVLALPVRMELRAGVKRDKRNVLLEALSGLPVARPTDETWKTMEEWTDRAAGRRPVFPSDGSACGRAC